jgi:hypothetical protein
MRYVGGSLSSPLVGRVRNVASAGAVVASGKLEMPMRLNHSFVPAILFLLLWCVGLGMTPSRLPSAEASCKQGAIRRNAGSDGGSASHRTVLSAWNLEEDLPPGRSHGRSRERLEGPPDSVGSGTTPSSAQCRQAGRSVASLSPPRSQRLCYLAKRTLLC